MNEYLVLIPVFLAGALLGVFFFGGLWWTVQQGLTSAWPAVWFLGSLLIRTAATLAGFYVVSQGHWLKLVVCMVGFVIARFVIMARVRRAITDEKPIPGLGVSRAH